MDPCPITFLLRLQTPSTSHLSCVRFHS